jgi:hypothetical protein
LFSALAYGQQPVDSTAHSTVSDNTSCSTFALQSASSLNLKQRGCYFVRQVFSPQFAASTGFMTVVDQSLNSPFVKHERWSKFPHRFEIFYARHAAQDAAEYLVGYLHHEDPRLHRSRETGVWKRTGAALLSVVTSPGEDGNLRPAFAPMAGSLSSAFVGTMMYRHSETLPTTMIKAAGMYGFYFARSVFNEFRPDLHSMLHKMFHR